MKRAIILVLDGVGAGAADYADRITTLVWMEAPSELRLARGLARDRELHGTADEAAWLSWRKDEDVLLAAHRTRERADLVVPGVG